jgi:HSP20 family protein
MSRKKDKREREGEPESPAGLGGILKGLADLVEKLGELAEKGGELRRVGEVGKDQGVKGVYGFSVKVGVGGEGIKVEPFGNIGKDRATGRSVVREVREPIVDVFEESDHILVVAEMPGVGPEDVRVDVKDDVLTITAERETLKYRKEVLLPRAVSLERMKMSCKNGVVKIKWMK